MGMKPLDYVSITLLIIGGLNWGLLVFDWNLVDALLNPPFVKIIYSLVGLSALYSIGRFARLAFK